MMKSTEASEEKLVQSGVVDIELGSLRKQRFRINGDNNRILELNTSDMGIITRLSELYPKLQELADKASLKSRLMKKAEKYLPQDRKKSTKRSK